MLDKRDDTTTHAIEITPEMIAVILPRIVAIVEGRTDTAFNALGIAEEIIDAILEEWRGEP